MKSLARSRTSSSCGEEWIFVGRSWPESSRFGQLALVRLILANVGRRCLASLANLAKLGETWPKSSANVGPVGPSSARVQPMLTECGQVFAKLAKFYQAADLGQSWATVGSITSPGRGQDRPNSGRVQPRIGRIWAHEAGARGGSENRANSGACAASTMCASSRRKSAVCETAPEKAGRACQRRGIGGSASGGNSGRMRVRHQRTSPTRLRHRTPFPHFFPLRMPDGVSKPPHTRDFPRERRHTAQLQPRPRGPTRAPRPAGRAEPSPARSLSGSLRGGD